MPADLAKVAVKKLKSQFVGIKKPEKKNLKSLFDTKKKKK